MGPSSSRCLFWQFYSVARLPLALPRDSGHAQKIALADLDAIVTKDAVSGHGMEIEIGECKTVEEFLALQRQGFIGTDREGDFAAVVILRMSSRCRALTAHRHGRAGRSPCWRNHTPVEFASTAAACPDRAVRRAAPRA